MANPSIEFDIPTPRPRNAIRNITAYRHGKQVHGTVRLSSNENTLGVSQKVTEAIARHLSASHLYPDPSCFELRQALVSAHGILPEQLVFGNGSDEILMFAAAAYLESGDGVLTSEETFPQYQFVGKVFNAEIETVPLKDFGYDLNALAGKITRKTKMIFLCNPNNPTGTYFTHSQLAEFLGRVPPSCLVVLDEAYSEYADASDFPQSLSLLNSFHNLLILRTFSKAFGLAGLRIGYGISHPTVIQSLGKVKFPFNVNRLAQIAAVAALSDTEYLEKTRQSVSKGKKYLQSALADFPVRVLNTQTNFLYLVFGDWAADVETQLESLGVTIKSFAGAGGVVSIRVTIGDQTQNEKFIAALRQYVAGKKPPEAEHPDIVEALAEAWVP